MTSVLLTVAAISFEAFVRLIIHEYVWDEHGYQCRDPFGEETNLPTNSWVSGDPTWGDIDA
jgi:hypothetical protein